MSMIYGLAADAVLGAHLMFVLFVVLGGLLTLRRAAIAWLHMPALAWAVFVDLSGSICPLTPLEVTLRHRAGEAGYSGDFVSHYLVALIYPEAMTRNLQIGLGAAVLLVNAAIYFVSWRRRR